MKEMFDSAVYIQLALVVFGTFMSGVSAYLWRKIQKREEARLTAAKRHEEALREQERRRQDMITAQNEAILTIIRGGGDIIGQITYCIERGYKQLYQVENIAHLYHSYHNLGGNGAITNLYEQFMKLPLKKEIPIITVTPVEKRENIDDTAQLRD